jgi:hypothetical protein
MVQRQLPSALPGSSRPTTAQGSPPPPSRSKSRAGDLEGYTSVVQELRAERDRLKAQLIPIPSAFDRDALRGVVTHPGEELGEALAASAETGRRVLAAPLGDRRIAVYPDAEKGFRVEGLFELELEIERAAPAFQPVGRLLSVVAGARSDRLHTRRRRLFIKMQFSS